MSVEWRPRGVGHGTGSGTCLVSKKKLATHIGHDCSGFVRSKADGERVVRLFKGHAYLDYRPSEPNWIQVKVAVDLTPENEAKLQAFMDAVVENGNMLSKKIIREHFGLS